MFKKFIIILVLFFLIIAGLQLLGGRDFAQLGDAWDKYQYNDDLSELVKDIGVIFSGEKINQGGLDVARQANRVMYRWTDEYGTVHNSERMPKVEKYEVIRMGDIRIETQKALDKEAIKKALEK